MSKTKVLFTTLLISMMVIYFWKSPWSPILDQRIQSKIVSSDIDEAISLLEWRTQYDYDEDRKKEDLWKAAQLSYIRSKNTKRTRRLLELCLSLPYFTHTTQARIYLANITFEQDPKKGVAQWENALNRDADYKNADRLWMRIATEYELLMEYDKAIYAWEKSSQYSDVSNMANLALGRLKLKKDPSEALEHFQKVKNDQFMERTRAAELGEKLAQWELDKEK